MTHSLCSYWIPRKRVLEGYIDVQPFRLSFLKTGSKSAIQKSPRYLEHTDSLTILWEMWVLNERPQGTWSILKLLYSTSARNRKPKRGKEMDGVMIPSLCFSLSLPFVLVCQPRTDFTPKSNKLSNILEERFCLLSFFVVVASGKHSTPGLLIIQSLELSGCYSVSW